MESRLISRALSDEIEAINAIFGPETLQVEKASMSKVSVRFQVPCASYQGRILQLERGSYGTPTYWGWQTIDISTPSIAFYLDFPSEYPDVPPELTDLDGPLSWQVDLPLRNAFLVLLYSLQQLFIPGNVCVFDLIETTQPLLASLNGASMDQTLAAIIGVDASQWWWLSTKKINMADPLKQESCVACLDNDLLCRLHIVPCGHYYCSDCFEGGWQASRAAGEPYTCCQERICFDQICSHTTATDDQKQKYLRMLAERDTPNAFFCGNKECRLLIGSRTQHELTRGRVKYEGVQCPHCHARTCVKCRDEVHRGGCAPADMDEVIRELDVRRCPKCGEAIEKNGGCPHMICRTCKSHWWWTREGTMRPYNL